MLKKLLPILLALLLCAAAAAEAPQTFTITGDMEFYSGPGTQYLQSAFHNTPPLPGEQASVLGRVRGADGQDWLFVRFTGHWFSQEYPVQYYLPAACVPECADAPLLSFLSEPNTLAVETSRIYADPEGTNYDGYLTPNEKGVTVLSVQGSIAYVEAINPFGIPRRGYISVRDLLAVPGASALPEAPQGTASLAEQHVIPLRHLPAHSSAQTLMLADGVLVLRYGTIPQNAPWGEALAVIAPDGSLRSNEVYRTHDGMEESTVEFLMGSTEGFRVCLFTGDDLSRVTETHYNPAGEPVRIDVRRYGEGEARPRISTTHYTVSLGRYAFTELRGDETVPLRVMAASGTTVQRNVPAGSDILDAVECNGLLLLPVSTGKGARMFIFDGVALLAEFPLPDSAFQWELQAVPMADGRIAMLLDDGLERWQVYYIDVPAATLTPGQAFSAPYNRRVALLGADGQQLLIALGGVDTQLLLIDGDARQHAGNIPGALMHASSDGESALLLMLREGEMRLERWTLRLP